MRNRKNGDPKSFIDCPCIQHGMRNVAADHTVAICQHPADLIHPSDNATGIAVLGSYAGGRHF